MKAFLTPARAMVALGLGGAALLFAGEPRPDGGRKGGGGGGGGQGRGEAKMPTPAFRTEVPAQAYDLILGRPTRDSAVLSVLCYQEREGQVAYGFASGQLEKITPPRRFSAGEPADVALTGLPANARVFYEFRSRRGTSGEFERTPERSFHTARPAGAAFTFTVQADPHLDFGTDPAVYRKSLANALAARTDFHVDLGDTFMVDKYLKFTDAAPQYLAQRHYFSLVGHSAPVFLVLGNHDGEQPARGGSGPDSMAAWSNGMRKRYFPNPVPDAFYTGNGTAHPTLGLLQNYYAWEWGDALFIALDPFWNSSRGERGGGGRGDNWNRSLGREQYEWLRRTLATSRARHTFVFLHHLVGGETPEGRGGSEASHFFEWGGRELDGRNTFAQKRPGWEAPIHELLVRRGPAIVFHGHDHLYVQQERDGIIYQLVPQPGHQRFDNTRSLDEYGYKSGVKQGASGILRVAVDPERAVVEYVRAYPDSAENATRRTGAVTHRYEVKGR